MTNNNTITIQRGAAFSGYSLLLKDAAGDPIDLTGCTPVIKARKSASKPTLFTLATSLGEADGEITIEPMTDEETLTMAIGETVWDLLIEDAAGLVQGPFMAGRIVITHAISRAES